MIYAVRCDGWCGGYMPVPNARPVTRPLCATCTAIDAREQRRRRRPRQAADDDVLTDRLTLHRSSNPRQRHDRRR